MKIFKITFTIVCIIFIILFSFLFYTKKHSSKNIKEPNEPVVSVVISSYNMADSLPDAIDSIVNQTFENWELIVINDGSSDKTKKILSKYKNNPKITIINNKKNIGLANSLNKGISIAKGKYIARMDADDISLPTRLERQVAFMNTEKVDLLSSSFYIIGKKSIVYHKNVDHNELTLYILMYNPFAHPTVMLRKDFLVKNHLSYSDNYPNAEDYKLWMDIFRNRGKMAVMGGSPVTIYHPSKHSQQWIMKQIESRDKIREEILSQIIDNYDKKMLQYSTCELLPLIIKNSNKNNKLLDTNWLIKYHENYCK